MYSVQNKCCSPFLSLEYSKTPRVLKNLMFKNLFGQNFSVRPPLYKNLFCPNLETGSYFLKSIKNIKDMSTFWILFGDIINIIFNGIKISCNSNRLNTAKKSLSNNVNFLQKRRTY